MKEMLKQAHIGEGVLVEWNYVILFLNVYRGKILDLLIQGQNEPPCLLAINIFRPTEYFQP